MGRSSILLSKRKSPTKSQSNPRKLISRPAPRPTPRFWSQRNPQVKPKNNISGMPSHFSTIKTTQSSLLVPIVLSPIDWVSLSCFQRNRASFPLHFRDFRCHWRADNLRGDAVFSNFGQNCLVDSRLGSFGFLRLHCFDQSGNRFEVPRPV